MNQKITNRVPKYGVPPSDHRKPISATIRECRDIRRFLSVRTVKGGFLAR